MRTSELAWSFPHLLDMVFLTKIQADESPPRPENQLDRKRASINWDRLGSQCLILHDIQIATGAGYLRIEMNRFSKRSEGLFDLA